MAFKRKLAVTTLAASMVTASLAGLPLSQKGLAETFGVQVASATAPGLNAPTLKSRLQAIHNQLNNITGGQAAVDALQAAIDDVDDVTLINDIVTKINQKLAADSIAPLTTVPGGEVETLFNLFKGASLAVYDPQLTELESLRTSPAVQSLLLKLDPDNDLTVASIESFILSLETEASSKLVTLGWPGRLALINDTNNTNRKSFLSDVISAAVPAGSTTGVSGFLNEYGISSTLIVNTLFALQDAIDAEAGGVQVSKNAFIKLAAAYFAYKNLSTTAPSTSTSDGSSNPVVSQDPVKKASDAIDDLAKKLEGASEAEKAKLQKDALAKAQEAITTSGSVDLSKSLKKEGDKSSATLDASTATKVIADIQNAAKSLGEKLSTVGVTSPSLDLTLTVNLGTVSEKTSEVTIPKDVLSQVKAADIPNVAVVVNNISVTVPVEQFNDDTSLSISQGDASTVTSITNLPVASNVYDFSLQEGNTPVTQFDKPVLIRLPINDSNLDTDLLTLAKIIEEKLQFYGGRVSGKQLVEARDSFSSYVVVENKVEFNDIASVKSWAGRQIQVVAAKGAIVGKAQGKFAPQDQVTRAEFAKMLISLLDLDNSLAKESFSDVNESDWFAPYVAAASQLGIIYGRTADKFDPSAKISRAEMATMIARALKVTQGLKDVADVEGALKGFSDSADISSALKSGAAFAASNGLIFGSDGKFKPNNNATRAEAAVVLYRTFNYK
ncbi:S-layer homology domain-containing protein [Cohnella faecalis]|uniref:S-layer homology domain-containing protein n=1 Tax=Cohnella faecalis TaxID=2315694 RepID=A0A398CYI7_9BACL|nr:S-layer homology domain-containing protein [Cohnella faecalis]RIE04291.1 S-layer homology domain-containing protein [Cohnella faecalis]